MSDLALGIAEFRSSKDWTVMEEAANQAGVDVLDVSLEEHAGVLLPEPSSEEAIFFELCPTYLVDGIDYAPGAEIGLPLAWRARFSRVVEFIETVLDSGEVERLWIAISDGFDHERTVHLKVGAAREQLFQDMEEYAPPNILYCIEA